MSYNNSDVSLIWESYKPSKDLKRTKEWGVLLSMKYDDLQKWIKHVHELEDKEQMATQYNGEHSTEVIFRLQLEKELMDYKKVYRAELLHINNDLPSISSRDVRDDVESILGSAENNATDMYPMMTDDPRWYYEVINTLRSNLSDSEYATPEVKKWFKERGYSG